MMSRSLYYDIEGEDSLDESGVSSLSCDDSFEFEENLYSVSHEIISTEQTRAVLQPLQTIGNSDEENNIIHYEYNDVRKMLENPDIIFIFGKDKTPVYGVKQILTQNNSRFCKLIDGVEKICKSLCGGPKQKQSSPNAHRPGSPLQKQCQGQLVIPITGFEKVVFQKIVEFVHCGDVEITIDCVFGVLAATDVFQLPTLRKACKDYVKSCTDTDRVLFLLQAAEPYMLNGHIAEILEKLLAFVDTNSTVILHHPEFVLTSKHTAAQILSRTTLGISSIKKREAAQRWMDEQYTCHANKKNCNKLYKLTKRIIQLFSSNSKSQQIKSNSDTSHGSKTAINPLK